MTSGRGVSPRGLITLLAIVGSVPEITAFVVCETGLISLIGEGVWCPNSFLDSFPYKISLVSEGKNAKNKLKKCDNHQKYTW